MAEPETSQSVAQSDRAAKPKDGSGPRGYSWKTILLAALGLYALLLIIQNSRSVSVSFVFFSQRTRVIYLVLLCMALGALIVWLIPRMRSGRKKKRSPSASERSDAQRRGPGGLSWKTIVLGALGIYALLLIILNSKTVKIDFVVFSEKTRVIFLALLSVALGALIMLLIQRMRRSRKKHGPAVSDPQPEASPASAASTDIESG